MIFIDIEGRMGHFRNHLYNSSLVTYPYPPRTAIMGIIASILGFEPDQYHDNFMDAQISLCIKSRNMYKNEVMVNHREPTAYQRATQVSTEYIRSHEGKVKYRIYYNGQLESDIIEALDNFNGYHLYLGATECLASVTNFGEVEIKSVQDKQKYLKIDSWLPMQIVKTLQNSYPKFSDNLKYEKYTNVYGWDSVRGKSLGILSILVEVKYGIALADIDKTSELTIAELSDGKKRTVRGLLAETSKGDIIYAF
ncbi:CRISPR-associated protein Cas5 [Candidatus Woesearchaeota archaeon]|nr:CRISPR-associated protein Cas5 [Candidatus Woesearchaeota archaeon]